MRLKDKVAVITGGASGIGWRSAQLIAGEGGRVVLGDLNEDLLAERRAELGAEVCATVRTDVREETDIANLVRTAVDTYGSVDLGVNAAGIGTLGTVQDHPLDAWQSVIDIDLTGVLLAVKHESKQMITQGSGGAIVNISSINGRVAAEGMIAYCSAKAGVDMVTKVAGLELASHGIRVNAIAPGYCETPLTEAAAGVPQVADAYLRSIPLGRAGQPDDIGKAVVYLLSDDASWVTGEILVVDGGEVHREYPRILTGLFT